MPSTLPFPSTRLYQGGCSMFSRSLKRKLIRLLLTVVPVVLFLAVINSVASGAFNSSDSTRQAKLKETSDLNRIKLQAGPPAEATEENQEPQYRECTEVRSGYCVLRDFWKASEQQGANSDEGVTLTTQGTSGFLHHLTEICRRWQGPISVAIYAPGQDFQPFLEEASRLRHCGTGCVKRWVTWHTLFDLAHLPPTFLLGRDASRSIPNCSVPKPESTNNVVTYMQQQNLAYPINVARNVARLSARTRYVLASDIELYPSINITTAFLQMLRKVPSTGRQVFVLPVFEVRSNVNAPENKSELQQLFQRKKAAIFHQQMCIICHRIPNFTHWLRMPWDEQSPLNVFLSVKRHRGIRRSDYGLTMWEPFFIGTNDEPLFDERLTWNGRQNKMQLEYELCLLDYDFNVLDSAFLVHAPGIKHWDPKEEKQRLEFVQANQKVFRQIEKELHRKHGKKRQCIRPDGHAGFLGKWRVK